MRKKERIILERQKAGNTAKCRRAFHGIPEKPGHLRLRPKGFSPEGKPWPEVVVVKDAPHSTTKTNKELRAQRLAFLKKYGGK